MTSHARFLKSIGAHSSPPPPSPTAVTDESSSAVDSDFVVILAALLCALICVLGLVAVARCAWLRRFSTAPAAAANKGLKKKVLKSLPKVAYSPEQHAADDCAICLSEFAAGEEIRVLPQCGHGFHVSCIDTWLGSHSSCPFCRQILGVVAPPARCRKCGGGLPDSGGCSSTGASVIPPPSPPPPVRDSFLP